jgi:Domain of unknown function (DUF4388)
MGDLAGVGLSPLLKELNRKALTGILTLKKGKVKKSIFLRDGLPIFASSNLKKDRIGEMLVAKGIISQEQLEDALKEIKETGKRMGAVLVEKKWLGAEQLFEVVRNQVISIIYSVFQWGEGEYHFRKDDLAGDEVINTKLNLGLVIFDGFKLDYTHDKLIKALSSVNSILADHPKTKFPVSSFVDESQDIAILQLIDGKRSFREIMNESGRLQEEVEEAIFGLLQMKCIRITGEKAPADIPAAEPVPDSLSIDLPSEEENITTSYKFEATKPAGSKVTKDGETVSETPAPDFQMDATPQEATPDPFSDTQGIDQGLNDLFSGDTPDGTDPPGADDPLAAFLDAPDEPQAAPAMDMAAPAPEKSIEEQIAERMAKIGQQTLFERLEIDPDANRAEVVEAYGEISGKFNPRDHQSDNVEFVESLTTFYNHVLDAYRILVQDETEQAYVQALESAPDPVTGHNQFCQSHAQKLFVQAKQAYREGKYREAFEDMLRSTRFDSANAEYLTGLGICYVTQIEGMQVDIYRSQKSFRDAMEISPYEPRNYFYMGVILRIQGYNDHARKYLERAIQLKPDYPQAQSELSVLGS